MAYGFPETKLEILFMVYTTLIAPLLVGLILMMLGYCLGFVSKEATQGRARQA